MDHTGHNPTKSFGQDVPASIRQRNTAWAEHGLERSAWEFSSAQEPLATIDGREFLLFSSSNYLGLSVHPQVKAAAQHAIDQRGTGSGGSRLTTGTLDIHHAVERSLAEWLGYDSAVYFATGYQANVGLLTALADSTATIFSDERNHASIIDGCRLSRARTVIYPHCGVEELDDALAAHRARTQSSSDHPAGPMFVVTDGLFSMDGTVAPIAELVEVAHRHGAWLIVDEAHSLGTLGPTGRGLAEETGARPDIVVGTASKALGSEGGFVCCDTQTARLLRNQSRPYVYSTSNAAGVMAATGAALEQLQNTPALAERLQDNVEYLTQRASEYLHPGPHPHSPIIPLHVGDEALAMEISKRLRERGIHVPAIRYPTVARGSAMLRVTVMATHTREQIDTLVDTLREVWTR
ncbi:aminotransferase class I/II-fold pyridoxal phosphate-dependent enzyme [Corynebacterium sp. zg254]|uniref:8-amino-7-oxononanoate synthase n=1 Tax=Corynebacterium zhongnanshanii TaxID=2768834 RepID=A0ABQ6VIL7_9CORY|nr:MULTISPECIES: 8-amino-7-oxononanoate synthase [Corynebacterium]KAB3523653.1 8-amino-7-oxononanoate synthase [Corynebacterium zhongnanshanii]MCR5913630.1 aminotransferase class I/II-fold pyridoxal phosphate-dependent enzyme [Corynebacterium sp. zg254]